MSNAEKTIINAFMESAAEIQRLRREVTRLQMENAELKARLIEWEKPKPQGEE